MAAVDRRVLRLALAMAVALALAYGLAFPLPFMAPLFVVFLSAMPGPPMGPKGLLGLLLVVLLSMTVGVLLIPLLRYYPLSAVFIVALGLFFSMYLTLILGKRLLGTFLTVGFTLISVAGSVDYALAQMVIASLLLGLATAVLCQWLVYPFFPDPPTAAGAGKQPEEAPEGAARSNWLAIRAMLIVMPAYLLALSNPAQYLMTIMKSVSLGQQASVLDARHAGRELLGSTFVGGLMAILFWKLLSMSPTLWMFFLWMLAFGLYGGAKMYGLLATRVAPSFWVNALVTMLILLGPAVEDSANGDDAMTAFLVRFATFVGVTLYAWGALYALESWRERRSYTIS
ncbi:MAG: hypothetical protein ACI87W_002198 [Halieaceae bacterium]|jgi:hypothetical protein